MRNPTLFGLKKKSEINVIYDVEKKEVVKSNGVELEESIIEISAEFSFSIPSYIAVNGVPLYPSKYEFINEGEVVYGSLEPPIQHLYISDNNPLNERLKTKKNTIKLIDLKTNDVNRKRNPQQIQVMGESAKDHAKKLVDKGILVIPPEDESSTVWHWCHFVSFRMLPTEKAQKKNNMFCGTAACNGHMANIEAAVKKFIYEYGRPLSIEVDVTTYKDSLVARRVRYRVFDLKGSKLSHIEYFDALTTTKSDSLDFYSIYERLKNTFLT